MAWAYRKLEVYHHILRIHLVLSGTFYLHKLAAKDCEEHLRGYKCEDTANFVGLFDGALAALTTVGRHRRVRIGLGLSL